MTKAIDDRRQSLDVLLTPPPLVQLLIELGLMLLQHAANANATTAISGATMMSHPNKPNPPTTGGPLFALGHLVATPHALRVLEALGMTPLPLLTRHVQGDWGDLDPADVQVNQEALQDGSRLFSSYTLRHDIKVWVITEADRSVTTVLMPDDY